MKEEDILNEIFEYVFSHVKEPPNNHRKIEKERKPHIKKKIEINFSDKQTFVKQTYCNNLHFINLIRIFLANKLKIDPIPVYSLIDNVQSLFLKYRGLADVNVPINDFSIIENISIDLLPEGRKNSPMFKSAAKSIVLHIFEMCDIGLPPQPDKKIKVPKRIADPSFFDESEEKVEQPNKKKK